MPIDSHQALQNDAFKTELKEYMHEDYHKNEDKDISLTPLELIHSLGEFDLDCCGVNVHPTAKKILSLPIDGLKEKWSGRVWCNPPYSNPLPWVEKMSHHKNGIALVLASTGTKWFQQFCFTASGILFLAKRPKFTRLNGSNFQIMRDCALIAFSKTDVDALQKANCAGLIKGYLFRA